MIKLKIELVPSTLWGMNLRSLLTRGEWDKLRRWSYGKADNRCEICNASGLEQNRRHAVECHERWEYDDINRIQKLVGVISLCPRCHQVKHFGRALSVGAGRYAIQHLRDINDWSVEKAQQYVEVEFRLHTLRSVGPAWRLDLRWLAGGESPLSVETAGRASGKAVSAGVSIVFDDEEE